MSLSCVKQSLIGARAKRIEQTRRHKTRASSSSVIPLNKDLRLVSKELLKKASLIEWLNRASHLSPSMSDKKIVVSCRLTNGFFENKNTLCFYLLFPVSSVKLDSVTGPLLMSSRSFSLAVECLASLLRHLSIKRILAPIAPQGENERPHFLDALSSITVNWPIVAEIV
ncbi:hypothetical protein VNO78_16357 [Psophocarpus tetragonolobus]|uniref:Uncharacterized protein n=1 Tax=Psophocarpus tetragonolobus TaxID=3891 RepID=A0AAN9XK21_PSOTE